MKIRGYQKALLQDKSYTSPNRARFRKGKVDVFIDADKDDNGEITIKWATGLEICKLCLWEEDYVAFIEQNMPLYIYIGKRRA